MKRAFVGLLLALLPMLLNADSFTYLPVPVTTALPDTRALGITSAGTVLVASLNRSGYSYYLWNGSQVTPLGFPPFAFAGGGISPSGQAIAGEALAPISYPIPPA